MYRGGNTINLDAKGRMALPTRYRESLREECDGQLVLTIHRDGCLLMYPLPQWEELEHQLVRLPNQDKYTRNTVRMIMGYATEVEMDGSGRILIPPRLREFARLEKRVELLALGYRFEIWNKEAWDQGFENWREDEVNEPEVPEPLAKVIL